MNDIKHLNAHRLGILKMRPAVILWSRKHYGNGRDFFLFSEVRIPQNFTDDNIGHVRIVCELCGISDPEAL